MHLDGARADGQRVVPASASRSAMRSSFGHVGDQSRHVVRRRHVGGVAAPTGRHTSCWSDRAPAPSLFIRAMKPGHAERRHARQCPRRGVVRRDERQVQQVADRSPCRTGLRYVVDAARTSERVTTTFRSRSGESFHEHHCGHHLGDAGNRTLILRVRLVENRRRSRGL